MESHIVFVLAVLLSTTFCFSPSVDKRYRNDYEYNDLTHAFYKLHPEARREWMASSVCKSEGADLMSVTNTEDIVQVHAMLKKYPDIGQHVWIASDGQKHESAEEPAIINLMNPEEDTAVDDPLKHHGCTVVSRSGEIESLVCYRQMPFVCKVDAKDAPYDPRCDLFAKDYEYNATIGSCYKIPRRVASWNEAYAECRAEGAHLVVLNSEAERAAVQALITNTPKVQGAQASWFFYAGFRANKPVGNETVVFKTIFNETLQEAGFAEWSPNEPNNALGNEYCGTIFLNDGKLNDVDCSHEYAFICEKEVRKEA